MKRIILLSITVITLFSCSNTFVEDGDDFFYIRRGNANMPVWVRGNSSSSVYIVILYGGPGGSSTAYWGTETFTLLEEQYRIVYWDQRSSGFATGTSTADEMTPEGVALDTDLLIDVINNNYTPSDIFLYGHSWGGLVGTQYLSNSGRQSKITGWIEVSGAHDWPLGMELSYNYMHDYAASRPDWAEILAWYDENPLESWNTFIPTSWSQHTEYIWEAYGYVSEDYCDEVIAKMSSSDINIHDVMNYTPSWSWFTLLPKVWEYDSSVNMDRILLPSKIIWGRRDGILPVALAQDAYDSLGTPDSDKSITILENSAHWIVDEEGREMFETIRNFIDSYS